MSEPTERMISEEELIFHDTVGEGIFKALLDFVAASDLDNKGGVLMQIIETMYLGAVINFVQEPYQDALIAGVSERLKVRLALSRMNDSATHVPNDSQVYRN